MTKKINCDQHLIAKSCGDYELLDSGDNEKLERFGMVIIRRPETQALWAKQRDELWADVHATFAPPAGRQDKKSSWQIQKKIPDSWVVTRTGLPLIARLTSFKHTGIFPEQSPNWEWLTQVIRPEMKVLNLFGYTGAATVTAALAGASITHVDASKQSLDWAHENARLSSIPDNKIRWILDDALAFVKREVRRSAQYDGIILDPPAFGRGAKGEVWKIEEDFPLLLKSLKEIFSNKMGSFFLVNGYAAGYAPRSFAQAMESVFGEVEGNCGELHIKEATSDRVIPAGIYVRFVR
ncbi:class I SAM-dependent rRNA methyltransferase [Candidatus Kaiserbacteria bacterium]|nr:class I SAM-dependent rRNA methyltransferase [Candidatus Kaiserbacteria bacterium]